MNYFALLVLVLVFLTFFYGVIIIHNIPYEIAKKRQQPHQDAIHVAGMRRVLLRMSSWMNFFFPFH